MSAGSGNTPEPMDADLDADRNDCCHGVEGPCPVCDPELFDESGEVR